MTGGGESMATEGESEQKGVVRDGSAWGNSSTEDGAVMMVGIIVVGKGSGETRVLAIFPANYSNCRMPLGGHKGFDKVIWEVVDQKQGENPSITFKYHSRDGEEGYPGDVLVTATYTLTSSTSLRLNMEAVPKNKPTPISLAQHTYWNLAGHSSGNILDHSAQIWATHITPVDQNTIPTGEIMPVKGTAFDFTTEKKIGSSISKVPGLGYDHNYVLGSGDKKLGLKRAAKLKDPSSTRVLNLWTDAPGMQFYTANYVNGVVGKGGAVYGKHAGVCLETQGFPNAINQPNFPSVVVQPGEKYKHSMLFEFSAE